MSQGTNLRRPYLLLLALTVVAPAVALTPLVFRWLPSQVRVAGLRRDVRELSAGVESGARELAALKTRIVAEQNRLTALRGDAERGWLPMRNARRVFDHCADALGGGALGLNSLAPQPVRLHVAPSDGNLLAAERIEAVCTGDYAGLAAGLDALERGDLPCRVSAATWRSVGHAQELRLTLDFPFEPDADLAGRLAGGSEQP